MAETAPKRHFIRGFSVWGIFFGLVAGAGLGACFTGTGAEGLPCEADGDCGLSLQCDPATSCCGGACLVGTTTSDTAETQTTSSTTDDSSTSTTTTDTTTDDSGSSTGIVPVCGNGMMEEGEECDEGMAVNMDPLTSCTVRCREPIFWWNGVDDPTNAWEMPTANDIDPSLFPSPTPEVGWQQQSAPRFWGSGRRPADSTGVDDKAFGRKSLRSVSFSLDVESDREAVLNLRHSLNFDDCLMLEPVPDEPFRDGGRVYIQAEMMDMGLIVAPPPMLAEMNVARLGDESTCIGIDAVNPWGGTEASAYVGRTPETPRTDAYVIPEELYDNAVRITLTAAFDCNSCRLGDTSDDQWVVEAVSVTTRPKP